VYAPHSCHTLQAARLVVGLNWFLLLLHMMSIVGGVGPRSFVLTIFLVRAPLAAVVVVVAVLPFFEVAFNSLSFLFCPFFVSFISFFHARPLRSENDDVGLSGRGVKKRIFLCNNLDAFLRFVAAVELCSSPFWGFCQNSSLGSFSFLFNSLPPRFVSVEKWFGFKEIYAIKC